MESNSEAFALIKSAQSKRTTGQIIGFVGGFLMGWSLGEAIQDEMDWRILCIGAGITIISFSFETAFNNKALVQQKLNKW